MNWMIFLLVSTALASSLFGPLSPEAGVQIISEIENTDSSELRASLHAVLDASESVSVIGLGEPVHGTHAFHPFRVSLIKGLVEEKGYRYLAFEIPQPVVFKLNSYLQSGQGDLRAALAHGYWGTWKDESVVELFQWLVGFNQKHPLDRVSVFGFDNQGGALDRETLLGYLRTVGSSGASVNLSFCLWTNDSSVEGKSRADRCHQALDTLRQDLEAHRIPYEQQTGAEAYFWAQIALENFDSLQTQFSTFSVADLTQMKISMATRDARMAKNFFGILDFFGTKKSILYAHNEHLAKNMDHWGPEIIAHESMGTWVDRQRPGQYLMVGGMGYDIRIDQTNFPGWTWEPSNSSEAVETYLAQQAIPYAIINTRGAFLKEGKASYKLFQGPDKTLFVPAEFYDFFLFAKESGPQRN